MSAAKFRVLHAVCIAVIGATPAVAADFFSAETVPVYDPEPASAASWSGFYFGGSLMAATSDDFSDNNSNLGAGFQAGYLQQYGVFVLGAELQAILNDTVYYGLSADAGVTQSWSAAAKVRAGFAFDNLLVYGTGGAVTTRFQASGPVVVTEEYTLGATLGAGLEYFFTETVSLRGEVLHTIYNDFNSNVSGVSRSDRLHTNAVQFGVNNHF